MRKQYPGHKTLHMLSQMSVQEPNSGCWLWDLATDKDGYAKVNHDGKFWRAARLSYFLARGPIPSGLQIDHLCRVRCCINPNHLEPVTISENTRRSYRARDRHSGRANQRTHCVKGHPFDDANTYVHRLTGARNCRTCNTAATVRYQHRKKGR